MQRFDLARTEGAHPEIATLLGALAKATYNWTDELRDVTEEEIMWQPFENGHSIGAIILHIADAEAYWLHEVAAGYVRSEEELKTLLSEEVDQYAVHWARPPQAPLSWYMARHAEIRARTLTLLRDIDDPEHLGVSQNREFTLRWLIGHVAAHEAYHGGQAVLLALIQRAARK